MSRFLRFCAFLSVLFLTTNVFAAGYTCPTAKQYTSCATNYYVSDCGTTFNGRTLTTDDLTAGNSCIECPDGYTCSGGLVCPKPSTVTIKYVTGGTQLGQSQPISGVAITLPTISRMSTNVPAALNNTNYKWTFAGWATAPNTNTVTYTDGASVTFTKNTVLYGVWQRTITLNYYASATAASVSTRDVTQYYRNISTTAAAVSAYARPALYAHSDSTIGWTPIGWSYGTTTEPQITSNITSSGTAANPINAPAELNAVYTRSADVTYNGNGNTGGSTSATEYTQLFNAANGAADSVSVTLASNGFTKTGYTFSKWAAGSTNGTQYAAGATFTPTNRAWTSTSSYPMYAIWTGVQSTVSFDANGGSGGQSADVTATYGAKMPAISATAPTRTGYTFMGWYDNATYTYGTQYYDTAGASVGTWNKTADTTLYAGWKANSYTISFDANGGSGGQSADVTAIYGARMPSISETAPTRTGYTFIGWYDNATYTSGTQYFDATGASARTWDKAANTTLYAGWRADSYTVSFNANGGSGGQSATVTATYDSAMPSISATAPTRTGYTFMGWYDNATYTSGTQYYDTAGASARTWDKTADTTLYAGWRANVYQVYFKTGNTNMGSQDFSYGVSQKLTGVSALSNIPVSSDYGWTFVGWSDEPDSTVEYTDGQSVSNLTTTHGGTVVLYGVWQRDVDLLYYSSATALQPTITSGVQSYYNSSTTAATRTAITLPVLATSTSYSWAPYGWALNSNTTTTATVSATTATSVTPAIDVGTTDGLAYTALYKRTATVSYSGNGATSGSTSSTSGTQYFNTGNGVANALTLTLASNGFTKTGYTFSKWAAGNAGAAYTFPNTAWNSAASVSTNATWTANQYTVTLDAGDIASGAVYTTYNTAVYTDSARTKAMSTSANAVATGLKPTKSVTVTYNANGGSVSPTSAQAYMPFNGYWSATSGGTQYIGTGGYITDAGLIAAKGYTANKTWYAQWSPTTVSLPTPTRTGYTFAGWATSSSATSGVTGNYSVTGDVTLYATWSANMTGGIALDSQYYASSSASTGTTVTVGAAPTPIYIKYDTGVYTSTSANATAITKLTTLPTYTGYTFQGFYTGKAGTGAQVIDASGNFLTVTLYPTAGTTATWYAHYTANCNQVLLNANGGTAGSVTKLYKKSGSGAWYTNDACTTSYAGSANVKPTRSGYTFRGFYLNDPADISSSESSGTARHITHTGETTNTGNNWKITGAAVLYAGWAKNCDPGDKATCSLTVGQTTTYTTGCDTGYHITSGVNTYAPACMANTYYVRYDSNAYANMGNPSWAGYQTKTYTYDTESYLEETVGLWAGSKDYTYGGIKFSFVGWSRTQGATTPDSDLESPSDTGTYKAWNLTTTNGATVYLYAVWSECLTCLPGTGATCTLVDAVTCTYETSCNTGYKEKSGAGTYNPKCDPIEYEIKYNANCDGATGTMANTVLDYTDKVNLTTNGFTCGTKEFLGWGDITGCMAILDGDTTCNVVYTQGQEVEKLTTVDGAVFHLYAVWGDCQACSAGTGASCWLTAPQGVCTYNTSCLEGYNTLVGDGTYNPSCSANSYTVEYNMNCPSGATCSSAPSDTTCKYGKTCIFSDIQSTSLYAGGYKLTGWASTTTGTGEAAGINLTTTNNGTVTRYAIWSQCAAGTYHPAGTGTAANVCTNAADGKFVAAAGATADVACAQGSYSEKSSASTQCVACPAGRTTSGTGTNYNATANTACSATCSNKAGVYAWATPSWSNNTVANLCTVTSCASTYYKNSNACALCSGLASGFYPNSDDGNSSGASACFTKELSGQYVESANAAAATDCENWTYRPAHTVNYGSTSTCAPCAAVPIAVDGVAWTKASGTKWTSYDQCVVTQTPANCASGTVKRTQTSTTAWGDTTLVSTLRSEDGFFADTSATACTAADDGYYATAGATSQTACAQGSYSTKSSASSTCTACPAGRTTSGTGTKYNATANTACAVTCSNNTGVYAWAEPSWSANSVANLCTVSKCNTNTYYTATTGSGYKNTCTSCGSNSGTSAGNTSTTCTCTTGYTSTGKVGGASTSTSGCSLISDIACTSGQYLPASSTTCLACTEGYWCPSSTKTYSYSSSIQGRTECSAGTYQPDTGQTSCLSADKGYYVSGTAKTEQTPCTGATYAANTGQASCTACPTATNDTANVSSYGYWNTSSEAGNHTVRAGCYALFKAKTLDDGAMTNYRCYVDSGADTYGVDGTSKTCWVNRTELTCDGGYYNATFNNSSTATQYTANKTLTNLYANACTNVGAGNWSADESLTRTACESGLTTIGYGTGANEAADCGRKLHMGDNVVYLRSNYRTTPSLRVKVGDTTFYGALSTSLSSAMKVKNGSTTYSVVNDYQ